jgi:hypothetical protein
MPLETPFEGAWTNTDPSSRGVVGIRFERVDAGRRVRAWAVGASGIVDLGRSEAPLTAHCGIAEDPPIAFGARIARPGYEVLLQGNLNRGLLILATYLVAGDSARGRFSREFYGPRVPPPTLEGAGSGELFDAFAMPEVLDVAPFIGSWRNAERADGLVGLRIDRDSESSDPAALRVVPRGSGGRLPVQWPSGRCTTFATVDELGRETLTLLAVHVLPAGRSELQIKVIKGVAVTAGFHERSDGRSWFTRDFFVRDRPALLVENGLR